MISFYVPRTKKELLSHLKGLGCTKVGGSGKSLSQANVAQLRAIYIHVVKKARMSWK